MRIFKAMMLMVFRSKNTFYPMGKLMANLFWGISHGRYAGTADTFDAQMSAVTT